MTRATFKTVIPDDQLKDGFDKISSTPMFWIMKAQDLLKASQILEEHDQFFDAMKTGKGFQGTKHKLFSVILMLRGMAFEALFKGLLTKQGTIVSRNGRLDLPPKYKKHNLRSMAEDVKGLDLEEDDYVTLFTLSKQISLARLPAKQAPTANEMNQVGWTAPHDEDVYHRVLDKVLAMY